MAIPFDRDRLLTDARALAVHLGITDREALTRLYVSIYDEAPPDDALSRFGAVLAEGRP